MEYGGASSGEEEERDGETEEGVEEQDEGGDQQDESAGSSLPPSSPRPKHVQKRKEINKNLTHLDLLLI